MKRIKISRIAVIALVMGIAASAFTNQKPSLERQSTNWYKFVGTSYTLQNVLDHDQYEYVPSQPCSGSSAICGVETEGPSMEDASPDEFTTDLKNRLTSVFNTPSNNPYSDIVQEQ